MCRQAAFIAALLLVGCSNPKWGTLANSGVDAQPIRTILFYAGHPLDGRALPQNICRPGINITRRCATVWPVDSSIVDWRRPANRVRAVEHIVDQGFNTISMSSWGESWLPCTADCSHVPPACCGKAVADSSCSYPEPKCKCGTEGAQVCRIGWYGSAPTQLSAAAQDELFEAAQGHPVLIMPFIESRFTNEWNFKDDFPTTLGGKVAPGLISQIEDLVNRYLKNPKHPEWKDKWALVYDQHGERRYAVAIAHVASETVEPEDHERFAAGFDFVAAAIEHRTQFKVGFFLDPIPGDPTVAIVCPGLVGGPLTSNFKARFRPDPEATGRWLRRQASILGIHAYSPEGWVDNEKAPYVDECVKRVWKGEFSRRWHATGIPFLQDVTPGWDDHSLQGRDGLHYWATIRLGVPPSLT